MLKACPYCGRIHDSRYDCGKKPKARPKADTATQRFRGSGAWKTKREQIRKRDKGLCQLCLRGYAGTQRQYEYDDLSVHHIVPIEEDYSRRLDDSNLILLCAYHHEVAEAGRVGRNLLKEIAESNNLSSGNAPG